MVLQFAEASAEHKMLGCWILLPGPGLEEGDLEQQDDDGRAEEVLDDLQIRFQASDLGLEVRDLGLGGGL